MDTHATIATNEKDRFKRRVQRTLSLLTSPPLYLSSPWRCKAVPQSRPAAAPSLCLFFCLAILFFLSRSAFLLLSSLREVTRQLEGWMGIWLCWPKIWVFKRKGKHTVGLISDDLFDVESPSLSVDGLDLTFTTLEVATHDLDGISLADGDWTDVVLGAELLVQVAAHDLSSDGRRGREVGLSWLSTLARHALVGLHLSFSFDS